MNFPQAVASRTLAAACIAALLLAGCSVLPKGEVLQVWQPPENDAAIVPARADFSIRVDTPNTTGMLANNAIVVMPAAGQVSTYKGARWVDPPVVLVRQRLVDAFMAARLSSVTTDDDRFYSNWSLSGDLRAYQTEYRSGSPTIVVRYDAQLRRGGSRRVFAAKSFVITTQPADAQVPEVVRAFGTADDQLAQQVVAWTLGVVRNAPVALGETDPGTR